MAPEQELRQHRCCFTGHRPEKLTRSEYSIRADLEREIRCAIASGYTTYISGMARGVDIWAAEIVLQLRDEGCPIRLICAIPHPGFDSRCSADWQRRYNNICNRADLVRIISKTYYTGVYQRRNEWMIDHAARVIAVYNGQPSGTKNTIDYAGRVGVPVHQIRG